MTSGALETGQKPVWSLSGNQGNMWRPACVTVQAVLSWQVWSQCHAFYLFFNSLIYFYYMKKISQGLTANKKVYYTYLVDLYISLNLWSQFKNNKTHCDIKIIVEA